MHWGDTVKFVAGYSATGNYFDLLGVRAAVGRTFRPEEDRVPQRDAVVVIGDGLWKRRFGGDAGIAGKTIQLDNRTYTIVGVMPPWFRGLSDRAEAWIPFMMSGTARSIGSLSPFPKSARNHPAT